MPIEFRRMVGVASLAPLVMVILMALGSDPKTTVARPDLLPDLLPALLCFTVWGAASIIAKICMIEDAHARVFTVVAVTSWSVFVTLSGVSDSRTEFTFGGLIFLVWIISWPLIDLVDFLIPQSWWKR